MIFGKEIKGRQIKFINLISKFVNGKAKRHIHIATYKHATFHLITVHSAIPKKKKPTQAKSPDVTHIKKTQYQNNQKKKEKKRGNHGFQSCLKSKQKEEKKK